jgi:hypothetical protein
MLVLDLDGVVTDPETGAVSGEVLKAVSTDLKRGVPVAFNTGRSLWLGDGHAYDRLVERHVARRAIVACITKAENAAV